MCEWCGHDHAIEALCDRRPKWSRRGFLAMLGAGVAGAFVAAKLPASLFAVPQSGTYGAVNRATFKFWRNQQEWTNVNDDTLRSSMREVYDRCSSGNGANAPDILIASPEMVHRLAKLLA